MSRNSLATEKAVREANLHLRVGLLNTQQLWCILLMCKQTFAQAQAQVCKTANVQAQLEDTSLQVGGLYKLTVYHLLSALLPEV